MATCPPGTVHTSTVGEKRATQLGVTPVQGRLHTLHNKPQVPASGSRPSSGHTADTAQPGSGISKAQPSLPAAHRGTFFVVLQH